MKSKSNRHLPLRLLSLLLFLPSCLLGYGREPDHGLLFNLEKLALAAPTETAVYHGMETARLVQPDDEPDSVYSNASMARLQFHRIAPGGGARAHRVDDFREQVFVVLSGEIEFRIGDTTLSAGPDDVVFIPPGLERSYAVKGEQPATVLQAEWRQMGSRPSSPARAFVTSEQMRPLTPMGGTGYLTVESNARQQGNALSIVSYGAGHINASNSLLLYHLDLPAPRNFTANTALARMGLSSYHPGGGTRWHFHPDREQAFVILAGRGLVEIGANTVEAGRGQIVFAPRHVGHAYKTVGGESFKFLELEWGR